MKQKWEQLAARIDLMSLRERVILFGVISLAIIMLFNSLVIDAQFAKQKMLADKIKQEQQQISAIQQEIAQRVAGKSVDPDADTKRRLAGAGQQLAQIDASLQAVQKNLVKPEKMAFLLEGILKRNTKLQLVSLKSLPATNVIDAAAGSGFMAKVNAAVGVVTAAVTSTVSHQPEAVADGGIYKHEVEIVLQGNYLDMLSYMRELESLPEQVYWSKGKMTVLEYPKASLQLNLFTLSLDKKWLNL